jgi:hypothetical protein
MAMLLEKAFLAGGMQGIQCQETKNDNNENRCHAGANSPSGERN